MSTVVDKVLRVEVCIDCASAPALVPFWLAALGYEPDPAGVNQIRDPAGIRPALWFQEVPEPKAVKNRVHLDVFFADQPAADQPAAATNWWPWAAARWPNTWTSG